jgi:RNA polymerase sigma-70 factor (ECF subfamily)
MQRAYTENEPGLNLRKCQAIDEEMNKTLLRHRPLFLRRAYRFLENAADAEDAVQDALLSAYKHIDQFRGEAQISTWLTAIVSNCARMHLRKRPRRIHVSLDEPVGEEKDHSILELLADRSPSPEHECQNSQLRARVKDLARQLSPSMRKAFELRALDGLSTSEAAQVLGVPQGTVKAQLARARIQIKRLLRRNHSPRSLAGGTYTIPKTSGK